MPRPETSSPSEKEEATACENPVSVPESLQEEHCGQHERPGLYSRARDAAARYLELRGYEILDRDWPCDDGVIDIVCWDGETLVFAEVQAEIGQFPDDGCIAHRRAQFEAMALSYLGENEYIDVPVRFDVLSLATVGRDRAFLKHWVNALGAM